MATVQELVQKLRLDNIAGNLHAGFFLRTIADGNCGPRAALQGLLVRGFLLNKREEAWQIFYNICTGHGHHIPTNIEFDELKRKYLYSVNLDEFVNDFMTIYCAPAGDPELRHDGDALVTSCSVLLRDQIQFDSEELFSLMDDDPNQFQVGENLNMSYALEYFKKLGVDLIIKYRNNPNQILQYEGDIPGEGFKVYIIYDNAVGGEHFDVFIPEQDLETYCNINNQVQTPVAPMIFSRPEQALAVNNEQNVTNMMHSLHDLFVSRKHQQVTVAQVQDIIRESLADPFAEHDEPIQNDEPIKKLVATVNEQNRMASILGCSNTFVDLICDFILSFFKADRTSVINHACKTFKASFNEPVAVNNRQSF